MKVENERVYVAAGQCDAQHRRAAAVDLRRNPGRRERKPIDIFFSALAIDQGELAGGVVLSGGDADGTLGIKAIKEHGGMTLAQVADGFGPQHPDMPDSAISTGLVDFAVPAEEMGAKLVEFVRGNGLLERAGRRPGRRRSEQPFDEVLPEIYAILRKQIGHEFSGYKTKTFLRRVQRRMQVVQLGDNRGLCRAAAPATPHGGRRAVPRPADQRHQLLPRRGAFDALAEQRHPAAVRGPRRRRHGARLGARLRHRRGGVLDRASWCASIWTA